MIKVPPSELHTTSSPWPFAAWGMDIIKPVEPAISNGHRFILVAIYYLTKWVEAASYKAMTKKVMADFVRDRIICRLRIPELIITDNGSNLNNDLMKAITECPEPSTKESSQDISHRGNCVKEIFPHQDEAKGKFSPKWQSLYMGHRVLIGGALILVEMDGEVWPKPINSDAVKHYYV
ncbi:uncharacterized protein [Nicotiana sylvestris]|uniref:uncharacterized protein n=1 Tax=Nicotiana sylvestris TaxID=4096 RepID=UPI00388CDE80